MRQSWGSWSTVSKHSSQLLVSPGSLIPLERHRVCVGEVGALFYILDGHTYALLHWLFLRAFLQTLRSSADLCSVVPCLRNSSCLPQQRRLPWTLPGSSLQPRESLKTVVEEGGGEAGRGWGRMFTLTYSSLSSTVTGPRGPWKRIQLGCMSSAAAVIVWVSQSVFT